jgi:hypothetical protein
MYLLKYMLCKQYCNLKYAHSLNASCLYIKNWPEDGSLEPKHVANYVLIIIYIYMYVVFE